MCLHKIITIKHPLYLLLSLLLITVTPAVFAVDPDRYESDNTAANATVIQPGVIQVHTIHVIGDEDWVKFEVNVTENIELKTTGLNGGTEITVYDSNLTFLDNDRGFSGNHALVMVSELQPGIYFAKINDLGSNGDKSDFNLHLTTTVGNGDNYEADNVHTEASIGTPGIFQNRSLIPANDEDWIKFTLIATDYIELKTTGLTGHTKIYVYDSNLTELGNSRNSIGHAFLQSVPLSPGAYFAKVDNLSSTEIDDYKLSFKTANSNGDLFEPDNILDDAINIFPGSPQARSIVPSNDRDWVKFTLTAIDDIELKVTGISGTNRIILYNSELEQIAFVTGILDTQITLNMANLNPGVYYASFESPNGFNEIPSYALTLAASFVAAPPSKPSTPTASDGTYDDKIQISWSSVSSANYYEVYRCTNTSVASCGNKFNGGTASPYDDTNVEAEINYYYRLKACNNIGCSTFSESDIGFRNRVELTNTQKGVVQLIIHYFLMDDD